MTRSVYSSIKMMDGIKLYMLLVTPQQERKITKILDMLTEENSDGRLCMMRHILIYLSNFEEKVWLQNNKGK